MSRRYSSAQKQAQVLRRRIDKLQSEKANPLYAGYSAISDMPQPRTMSRNIKSYIEEGYCSNDTLNKVIGYGITNGAAIPPVLFTDRTMKKRIDNHPILDKLETPNSEMDGVFYRECVLGWFLLAGSSFMYINRLAKSGPPDELWVLEANKVKPIPDEKRGITGYEYADFSAEKNPIAPGLIGHIRNWNPRDPFFGLSPITVAAILVDQQSAIRKWNLALLQNFAKPPGAWVTDSVLDPNTRSKLEARVNEKLTGYRNAGKTPVLDGALKWQPSAVSPADMDWLESTKYNAGAIANVFNMPPQLIGDTSSTTFDNMQEAKAASYTEYIFPMLDKKYSTLRRWLVPMYPDLCDKNGKPTAYLYYDKETVEVVQQVIQARKTAASQRANQSYSQGAASTCTLNEAREMQGLPPDPQGDVYRIGAVLVPKNKLEEYAEQSLTKPAAPPIPAPEPIQLTPGDPSNPPGTDDTSPAKPKKPVAQEDEEDDTNDSDSSGGKPDDQPSTKPVAKPKSRAFRNTKALDLTSDKDKDAYRKQMEDARERWTDDATERIAAYFSKERKAVVKALKEHDSTTGTTTLLRGVLADLKDKLSDTIVKLWQDVGEDIGNEVAQAFDTDEKSRRPIWEHKAIPTVSMVTEATVKRLLAMAGTKVKYINETTLKLLRVALADGVAEGESIPQLAKRIDALYLDEIIPNRSTTIARTEILGSSNFSAHEAASQFSSQYGVQLTKQWLATGDNRTRPTNVDADGQEVGLDEPFIVGGEELQYPGDPAGSASQICDCRCTQVYNRVTGNTSEGLGSDDSVLEDEKRIRREDYRKFMEKVLV